MDHVRILRDVSDRFVNSKGSTTELLILWGKLVFLTSDQFVLAEIESVSSLLLLRISLRDKQRKIRSIISLPDTGRSNQQANLGLLI